MDIRIVEAERRARAIARPKRDHWATAVAVLLALEALILWSL